MSTSILEIVELPDGDFALRRSDDEDAPLVRISFSQEARDMMEKKDLSVAKAMMTAGIEAVGNIAQDIDLEEEDEMDIAPAASSRTLH
ncbi:MAG: hypothetical protein CL581_00455 [Alteromonadaceae bacterium]|uniref:hypothetical protein n=1 Tax=unclassified Marinobacter TaxID=83889 RepID=UPI000C5CA6E4|nr:hypothetical protein [Marinobacter sp. BGYM27]MAA63239.1 hypothetical protein [Alteromonadaceae bacterium]MBH84229.1 hypothetical protein [Alteromonadaceae bacterium]MDG5498579.1 hypothetical protein [Marinobacter sp. BGYM27]|tara:strand:+ start:345 stop:608 length:264 start_codon:yes stop_codon:yes gene_type:complete